MSSFHASNDLPRAPAERKGPRSFHRKVSGRELAAWARFGERAQAMGYAQVAEYADAHPRAGFRRLACNLGGRSAELEALLFNEACWQRSVGTFAQRALVRCLHEHAAQGWATGPGWPWAEERAFEAWSQALGPQNASPAWQVWEALRALAPRGWLPATAEDERVVRAFAGVRWST